MKAKSRKTFLYPLVIFTLITTQISATESSGATLGKTFKAAGRTTSAIPTMLLSGSGAPSASVGINGDFYIDTKTFNLFGPKANGKWPVPINLKGPTGLMGPQGVDGKTGSTGSVSVGSVGDTGAQGTQGDTGATGEKGDKGDTGSTGATGERGATGASGGSGATGERGATGASGGSGATGSQGAQGAQGATGGAGTAGTNGTNGTNGSIGSQGAQGLKGDTGTVGSTGSTGPSNAYYGDVTFVSQISGNIGNSSLSNTFGNFTAGKSYLVNVIIYGTNTFNSSSIPLSISITATSGTPIKTTNWTTYSASSYRDGTVKNEYCISALVVIDGTLVGSTFNIRAEVFTGENLGASSVYVTLVGKYVSQLVGSIG
jgi:Collagen triple helix repeat (20 copies)